MYALVHWNGSESNWVESGPYIDKWFETKEEAEAALTEAKSQPSYDGWQNRHAVLSDEELYNR